MILGMCIVCRNIWEIIMHFIFYITFKIVLYKSLLIKFEVLKEIIKQQLFDWD